MRQTKCQVSIDIFLAALFLLIISFGSSSAQVCELNGRFISMSNDLDPADSPAINDSGIDGSVGVAVQNWRGFATKDDESIPIKLNVQTIRAVDPAEARRLLALNLSLEEVRHQVGTSEGGAISRGRIMFNNDSYRLMDIRIAPLDSRSALNANIAGPMPGSGALDAALNASCIVGNLAVTISEADGSKTAEGQVTINDSRYNGTYSLKLNECFGKGPGAGKLGGFRSGYGRRTAKDG